jgi:hypothetical protein
MNGLSRFTFYTEQINVLLSKAREQKNPSIWLFENNARTPFFMLEGLSKLYAASHNEKKFSKLEAHFKLIEDGLGQIDYYNWLSNAFSIEIQIPADSKQYIKEQLTRKALNLNKVLTDKNWLSNDNIRLKKINKKLKKAGWLNPGEEVEAIAEFYKASIASINEFVAETNYHFDNVEEDVHELRRKLRWLSIYPQALQGTVQYAPDIQANSHLEKYLTEEIVNSPYNKFPAAGNNTICLMLDKNYFLALSWIIAKLGSLKDEGLLLSGLCEGLNQRIDCNDEETLKQAYNLLGSKQRTMQEILDEAEIVTKTFFKEDNLQHLITNTTKALG